MFARLLEERVLVRQWAFLRSHNPNRDSGSNENQRELRVTSGHLFLSIVPNTPLLQGSVRVRTSCPMTPVWHATRLASGGLRRSPGATAAAVVTLTLVIGLTAAIFSVVYESDL